MTTNATATHYEPIRLAGRTLHDSRHVCAFFRSREEQNQVLIRFSRKASSAARSSSRSLIQGITKIISPRAAPAASTSTRARRPGQYVLAHWEDAYLKDGYFDGDRMIAVLEELLADRSTYKRSRLMGNMEWALETAPGVTDIIEYETKLNIISPKYPDPIVCVYDLNKHSGSVVMDVLRTHPMVIVGGVLQENPLYVPPEQFLEELQGRHQH